MTAREYLAKMGVVDRYHTPKMTEKGGVIVDPKGIWTSELMEFWARENLMSIREKSMTVKEIVIKYLKDNGYDGLCDISDECGCSIDDLFPCDFSVDECEPAYIHKCSECKSICNEYESLGHCFKIEKQNGNKTNEN